MKHQVLHIEHCHPERLVPDELAWYGKQLYNDHAARYEFAKKFVKGKTVLDIACGSGYGSRIILTGKAKKVIGIDNAKEAIVYAKKRYPNKLIEYKTGDAVKIPLTDSSVDVIVSFETLEHVKEYKKFIREIQRVLKKNGILIISTPNKELGTEATNPFHFKEFYIDEFKNLLQKEFKNSRIYGQKPIHLGYLKLIGQLIQKIPPGKLNWFLDSGFKFFFRGTKVLPLTKFRMGFTPSYLIGTAVNRKP